MNTRIAGKKVLAIVLAGGKGSRLAPLTTERAKPAVSFLGTYRLIDFSLSNLVHSGIGDVWVIEQYLPHGLNDHLSGGRPWDLDRTRGGLVVMPPFSSPENEDGEFAQGNAHALAQHVGLMREFAPDVVVVMSADHIYKLDYSDVIREHVRRGASVTMVTTDLEDEAQATRFGNVRADGEGRVTEFAYKPDEPLGKTVTAEVFVYDAAILMDTLDELERQGDLGDYGEELLPALVARGDAHAFGLEGYWMDVGTLDAYMQTHQDFLDGKGFLLDTPDWPFITSSIARPPTRIHGSARLDHAYVCGGAEIRGEVLRSVIGPNAVVEEGASVRDSIVQPGATVRAGASVSRAIVDQGAVVEANAVVGGQSANSRLSVIGAHSVVESGARIGPGLIVEPRQTVRAGREDEVARPAERDSKAGK
ncbi:glucose-1-phosphate adenylyltransferase family protein [Deinococcus sp. MIMF12]|uniref:Glucose-1-phosphate adenylyltransferase family protein n=1 Tax=Deinococcus rhizophilus TaxID=3049544 RepID=A0ABT7JC58_9DEIO|nr:glucose-1-phosphate adenylyltransferase family protein [Deinococcus rhizophilus]MDL2342622.1 glucose-1-phosphate adenylyltransferase family protein [Deinococcus rhizophilus]